MLLHQNSNVRTYVLARTDIENLVSLALPPLFSSPGTGPAGWGVTSCLWPLFCCGSNRFWITHWPVPAHLRIFVTSSQACAAEQVAAVKGGTANPTRPYWSPSFSVPLSWPRSNLPTSDHCVEKLVADIISFIILFIAFGYAGQKVAQAVSVLSGVIVNKMSCNWTNMPNVLQGWPKTETPQGAAQRFYRNTTVVPFSCLNRIVVNGQYNRHLVWFCRL